MKLGNGEGVWKRPRDAASKTKEKPNEGSSWEESEAFTRRGL